MEYSYSDGLDENVKVAHGVIEASNRELAELEVRIAQQEEAEIIQESMVRTYMHVMRAGLQRQIKDIDDQEESELQTLSVLHAEQKSSIVDRIAFLKRKIEVNLAAIAPIRKLPPEILGLVFQAYVDLDEPPWFLAIINRSWRRVSLSTPSLWIYLAIANDQTSSGLFRWLHFQCPWRVYGEHRFTEGKRLGCRNSEEFQILASRSGNVPLDIRLDHLPSGEESETLHALFGSYLSSRIGSLHIQDYQLPIDFPGLNLGPLPRLQHLSIFATKTKPWAHTDSTPLLRLFLGGFGSSAKPDDVSRGSNPSLSLRSLNLDIMVTRPAQFNQIIRSLINLETLSGNPKLWPDASTPITTFSRLTSVELECDAEHLARIRLPALKTLNWIDQSVAETAPAARSWELSFPQLTNLVADTFGTSWLSRLSAPLLREVTWSHQHLTPASISFPNTHIPSVERFLMCSTCPDNGLVAALACFPNVVEISLSPGPAGIQNRADNWGLGLLKKLADAEMALCPKLLSITLGTDCFPPADKNLRHRTYFSQSYRFETSKTLAKPVINAVIKSRKKRGIPLERFEVAWTKRKGNRKMETIQYV